MSNFVYERDTRADWSPGLTSGRGVPALAAIQNQANDTQPIYLICHDIDCLSLTLKV